MSRSCGIILWSNFPKRLIVRESVNLRGRELSKAVHATNRRHCNGTMYYFLLSVLLATTAFTAHAFQACGSTYAASSSSSLAFPKWDACARYFAPREAFHRSKVDRLVADIKSTTTSLADAEVHLVDVPWLKPHEEIVSETHVKELRKATLRWGAYVSPLLVDRVTGAILDGHHRYHVGMRLGLQRVPAVLVDYASDPSITVDVWDGCGIQSLTKEEVLGMALSPKVFPPKTSKHSFSDSLPPILVPLQILQNNNMLHTTDYSTNHLDYHI